MKKKGGWKPPFPGPSFYDHVVPGTGGFLGPEELRHFFHRYNADPARLIRQGIKRLTQTIQVDSWRDRGRGPLVCLGNGEAWPKPSYDTCHDFSFDAVRKRTLPDCPTASVGGEVKSRMREVPSRKADRPVVGLGSGGKAPALRLRRIPVPDAEGILDGIGTGDTTGAEGSKALHLAASESRARRGFHIDVDGDPWIWTQGEEAADWSHGCERPFFMTARGRPTAVATGDIFVDRVIAYDASVVAMAIPCRKCWPCQMARKRVWIARAINEARIAKRTWFFTGTFAKTPDDPAEVVDEYQRFNKRLRKAGFKFRFLSVLERGERFGRMHVHMLIHGDLKYRDLQAQWTAGFMQAKLVKAQFAEDGRMDEDSARQIMYVAGYVTGDIEFKVRASLRYGRVGPPQTELRRKGDAVGSLAPRETDQTVSASARKADDATYLTR